MNPSRFSTRPRFGDVEKETLIGSQHTTYYVKNFFSKKSGATGGRKRREWGATLFFKCAVILQSNFLASSHESQVKHFPSLNWLHQSSGLIWFQVFSRR